MISGEGAMRHERHAQRQEVVFEEPENEWVENKIKQNKPDTNGQCNIYEGPVKVGPLNLSTGGFCVCQARRDLGTHCSAPFSAEKENRSSEILNSLFMFLFWFDLEVADTRLLLMETCRPSTLSPPSCLVPEYLSLFFLSLYEVCTCSILSLLLSVCSFKSSIQWFTVNLSTISKFYQIELKHTLVPFWPQQSLESSRNHLIS